MTPEGYQQLIVQCVGASFEAMVKDLEVRLGLVLSRHLPKDVVINMAESIAKDVSEEITIHYFASRRLEQVVAKLL